MRKIFNLLLLVLIIQHVSMAQPSSSQNYVLTNTVKQAGITTEYQVYNLPISTQGKSQIIAYSDGLGRSLQTVVTQGSNSQNDIVSPIEYDAYGREVQKNLPYSPPNGGSAFGGFRINWKTEQSVFYNGQLQGIDIDGAPYKRTVIETSPLNRVLAQGEFGSVWQPNINDAYDQNKKVVQIKYEVNKSEDNVFIFNVDSIGIISRPASYGAGLLNIKTIINEHGSVTKEYTDKNGQVILKRIFVDSDSLQTYFIFDNFQQLRAVVQPEGVAAIPLTGNWMPSGDFVSKWMFLYRYDFLNRMVMKKTPGADSILMVYDKWDRIVLMQDGNRRNINQWLFTKYDQLNRPIITGSIIDTRSQNVIRAEIDTSSIRYENINVAVTEGYTLNRTFPSSNNYTLTLYSISHYDSYVNLPSWSNGYLYFNEYGIATKSDKLQGQIVATQIRILNTSNWLRSVTYYDDKNRPIQVISDNSVGGTDRLTKILSFDGKPLQEYHTHTSRFYTTAILTKRTYSYDHADRVLKVKHKIGSQEEVTVSENFYNEMGQLLNKKLHQAPSRSGYLQKLDYSYNIRGWLNAINRPYSDGQNYDETDLFNLELHYNITNLQGATPQYNGNIAEQVWKGGYDEYLRGYKYTYDKANRLLTSDYGFKYLNDWNSMVWDFSMKYNESIGNYDRNGNIKQILRYHGSWNQIDNLQYTGWDGNKVLHITDWVNANIPVGFTDHETYIDDYQYDANGNMTFDYNKGITAITYNHLNLPTLVTMGTKGTIAYTYDAAGNKLQKTVTDQTVSPNKISNFFYAGAFVYRSSYLSGNTPGPDTLELVTHEEGRLRPVKIDTTQALTPANLKYIYDYFLKDHLGNTRMVVTTETQTDLYAATMEAANATKENQLFNNISSTTTAKPSGFDTNGSNAQVSRLNGDINTSGNKRVGPSLIIKVMAGDTISLSSYAWYTGSTQAPPTGLPAISSELIPLLTNGIVAANGTHGGAIPTTDINNGVTGVVNDFLTNTQTYDNTRPKAFMNWVIVDEEFKKVNSANHMGAIQIPLLSGGAAKAQLIGPNNMVVRRNGWLYVYLSNESNQNVYFDDLVVNHKRGPLVEATDYYAFGMQIPGLSTQANKGQNYNPNRYKYNGKELQGKELNDGSGLEWEDFGARMYDAQIGRWMVIDPKSNEMQNYSPYSYAFNNPIKLIDPDGKGPTPPIFPGVVFFFGEFDIGGGLGYGLNYLVQSGVAWDEVGKTHYTMSTAIYISNQEFTDKNPNVVGGASVSITANYKHSWAAETFYGLLDENMNTPTDLGLSIPHGIPAKAKIGSVVALNIGFSSKDFTIGGGLGVGVKLAYLNTTIDESISLTDREAAKVNSFTGNWVDSWSVTDVTPVRDANGFIKGYTAKVTVQGADGKPINTGISVNSGVSTGSDGTKTSNNVWMSANYIQAAKIAEAEDKQ